MLKFGKTAIKKTKNWKPQLIAKIWSLYLWFQLAAGQVFYNHWAPRVVKRRRLHAALQAQPVDHVLAATLTLGQPTGLARQLGSTSWSHEFHWFFGIFKKRSKELLKNPLLLLFCSYMFVFLWVVGSAWHCWGYSVQIHKACGSKSYFTFGAFDFLASRPIGKTMQNSHKAQIQVGQISTEIQEVQPNSTTFWPPKLIPHHLTHLWPLPTHELVLVPPNSLASWGSKGRSSWLRFWARPVERFRVGLHISHEAIVSTTGLGDRPISSGSPLPETVELCGSGPLGMAWNGYEMMLWMSWSSLNSNYRLVSACHGR